MEKEMDKILTFAVIVETVGWIWLATTLSGVTAFIFTPVMMIFVGASMGFARLLEIRENKKKELDTGK
jgi:hypothetical protein